MNLGWAQLCALVKLSVFGLLCKWWESSLLTQAGHHVHVDDARYKPGTLSEAQSRLLGLPPGEVTLCMTDVAWLHGPVGVGCDCDEQRTGPAGRLPPQSSSKALRP